MAEDDHGMDDDELEGKHCVVWSPAGQGVAMVTLKSSNIRDTVLKSGSDVVICGVNVQQKEAQDEDEENADEDAMEHVAKGLFLRWSAESHLTAKDIVQHFDGICQKI